MNKLKYLQENHNDDFMLLVDNLYKQKCPKKKKEKTICHFQALGNTYNSDIFVRNYIQFMDHVTYIKPLEEVSQVMKNYISDKDNFSDACLVRKQAVKLKSGLYLNTFSATEVKLGHIKKICKVLLKCDLKFL